MERLPCSSVLGASQPGKVPNIAYICQPSLTRYCGPECQEKVREEHREECKQSLQEREERQRKEDQDAALLVEALEIPISELTYSMWVEKFERTLNKIIREELWKN